ncbi:hypothetical protein [Caenispirillum bisanense]|uniref:hypothetical protein n=1 Tax=Caenispirillum bisanense TaxID=414052 RepID=UPI0031D4AD7E
MTAVLGIDVGWAAGRKSSAACRLEWDANAVGWRIVRMGTDAAERQAVLDDLVGEGVAVCAIDGPLHGSLAVMDRYRLPERLLTRGFGRIGKPGQSNSPTGRRLNEEANAFARLVLETGRLAPAAFPTAIHPGALAEAFPTSFLGTMMPDGRVPEHGLRSDVYWSHLTAAAPPPPHDLLTALLADLLPGRACAGNLTAVRDHDERAALVCALTAAAIAADRYVAVGDGADGYIHLGPWTQPWALEQLHANAAACGRPEAVVIRR